MKNLKGKVKVRGSIQSLPVEKRITPDLCIGKWYYISFGSNNAYPCRLREVLHHENYAEIVVEIPVRRYRKPKSFGLEKRSIDWGSLHTVYPDEIGYTPEHAVQNTVR